MAVRLLAFLLFLVVLLVIPVFNGARAYGRSAMPMSGCVPIVVTVQPTAARAGDEITVTVVLNETTDVDQEVRVSTDASMFTDWTQYVTVPSGSDRVTFKRNLTANASGAFSVSASCNNGAAASPATIVLAIE
jgi:hypothetical protein